jgi:glycosyltransferase involved in cell wall biosynthesis
MTTTTKEQATPRTTDDQAPAPPRQVIGRFVEQVNGANGHAERGPAIAVFCHEAPDSFIGAHVARLVPALARRGRKVHLFCPTRFDIDVANVRVHEVGAGDEADPVEQAQQFARRAGNAFMQALPSGEEVQVLGFEWSSAPVLSLLKGLRNLPSTLSLHSLERQRSDLSGDLSRRITEVEYEGIQAATTLLVHDPATVEVARQWVPQCIDRVVQGRHVFPTQNFERDLDPGEVKAKYQVGPTDPTLLYVGDLDERYGPDVVLKAMPAILRHHPQARLVIVGDGHMLWPLKVYARYLLLEHAVRLVGDVRDQALQDLFTSCDLVVVPSRESTPWWPIQAGWAARKPVVATHEAARGLTEHEKDSVLVYPSENSVVWGVERVLYDEELRKSLGVEGRKKLEERCGWNGLAEQLEEVLASQAVAR